MNSISPNEPATQWRQTIVINSLKKISQKSLRAMCRNRNSKCSDILLERMFSAKKKKNGECLWQLWVLVSILNCWVFSNRFLGLLWLWISRRTLSVSVKGTETSAPHFVITRSTNILQNLQRGSEELLITLARLVLFSYQYFQTEDTLLLTVIQGVIVSTAIKPKFMSRTWITK